MKFWSDKIKDGGFISPLYAAGAIGTEGFAPDLNPPLAWDEVPQQTQSFVLICHDPDAPSVKTDVNKTDREVPAATPRSYFFHWVLVDLPADLRQIGQGEFSDGFVVKGKPGPAALHNSRQGLNDYTSWSAKDPAMAGSYFGYDGPYPPFNDSIPHRYIFTLYALAVPRLEVAGSFTGQQVLAELADLQSQGKVLAVSSFTGLYTLNPRLAQP